ncbi:NifU family protein [Chloroflexota bacterium]
MREKVARVLDEIRPDLEDDGMKIELVDVKEGVVSLRIEMNCGSCTGCSMSADTVRHYIERKLKAELYGIKEVVAV